MIVEEPLLRVSDSKKLSEVETSMPAPPEKKARSRKTDAVEPVAKLTEDQIRSKYEGNEEYQFWTGQIPKFKTKLDLILKKGLPKLYFEDEPLNNILQDHSRLSALRDTVSE